MGGLNGRARFGENLAAAAGNCGAVDTSDYSTPSDGSQQYSPCFAAALAWLRFGIDLLPAQPDSKHLVAGFGPRLRHVTTPAEAKTWFQDRRCNLALVCGAPAGLVVLDFDSSMAYLELAARYIEISSTLIAKTRRGFHCYFLWLKPLKSARIGDAELKADGACVMAPPSVVAGHVYTWANDESPLLELPADLSLLSERSAPVVKKARGSARPAAAGSPVARAKAAFPIVELVGASVKLTSDRDGRWYHGNCPLCGHIQDFWVDAQRGLWGCHACSAHGDQINWYARLHNLTVTEAVRAMAGAATGGVP